MAPNIDNVAREIFDCIMSWTDKDTHEGRKGLRGLRAMNRTLSRLLAPVVFETVGFWISIASLDKVDKIALHPELYLNPSIDLPLI